jgi:hypothetical protein
MRLGLIEVPAAYANVLIESELSIRASWQGLHFAIRAKRAKFIQVKIHDIFVAPLGRNNEMISCTFTLLYAYSNKLASLYSITSITKSQCYMVNNWEVHVIW